MSWQDELHQLDADLASGLLSADEYRRRRDHLLVRASGQAANTVAPLAPRGLPTPPNPRPVNPFPPAFNWQRNDQEATQIMRPVPGPGPDNADRTQVVAGDAERTQVVPAVRAPVPPVAGPSSSQATPWGGPDAQFDFGTPSWLLQGPEVFRESPGSRFTIVVVGIAVLVVVLVVVLLFLMR